MAENGNTPETGLTQKDLGISASKPMSPGIESNPSGSAMVNSSTQEISDIPQKYRRLNSTILNELWTIPYYYNDPEKTKLLNERRTNAITLLRDKEIASIPQKYKGLNSEILRELWTLPEFIDQGKKTDLEMVRMTAIGALELKESAERYKERLENFRQSNSTPAQKDTDTVLNVEQRKQLRAYDAGYELVKIAKRENIDLSKVSREEYANYAIKNSLAIDDDLLRGSAWQRMETSLEELMLHRKEKRAQLNKEAIKTFDRYCGEIKQKASGTNRYLAQNVRVRQGTKDSNGWLYFGINDNTQSSDIETYKSYISVKDIHTLTPDRFTQFMFTLRDSKYNGDIKIFQDLEIGVNLNDQIVMHGSSKEDATLALKTAEMFFGDDLDQKSFSKDEVIDGVSMSYSVILAKKIADAIKMQK